MTADAPKILGRAMVRFEWGWNWHAGALCVQVNMRNGSWFARVFAWKTMVCSAERRTVKGAASFANGKVERLYASLHTANQGGR